MTLCRKCGKEIPDGTDLCEDCQLSEVESDESYLDELMQSMEAELGALEEPVAKQSEAELVKEELMKEEPFQNQPLEDEPLEEKLVEQEPVLEEPAVEEPVVEEPAEEEPVLEEPVVEEPAEGEQNETQAGDDLNELLDLLSKDYEDYDEIQEEETPIEEVTMEEPDESPAEASLFSDDDEDGGLFADDTDSVSVEDIFGDALSAVDYSAAEQEGQDEVLEEFVLPEETEENSSEDFKDLALDPLSLNESEVSELNSGLEESPAAGSVQAETVDKKESIWKRVFGNIITEQSAEEEARDREQEQATAEEKARAREEKKQQMAAEKAEKAEKAKVEKDRKAAERAERAAVRNAEKEEKKRLKLEMEANEVVGKINPLGASIVMVFFGLLCVLVILGSQSLSYTSSVKGAESSFEERDYKGAYESLAGVEVSESSQEMKDKIRICMQLQRELDAYDNYYEMKMYLEALDSLMKGIRSYDANRGKAEEYDILGQYNELEVKLAKQLYDEFGVSESQARSINATETQEEYTSRLENIIAQWEQRNKEDER